MKLTEHRFKLADSFKGIHLEDESVHLMITSPPYPMVEMWDPLWEPHDAQIRMSLSKNQGPEAFEQMHALLDKTWEHVYRVLAPGGIACINIGDATRSLNGRFQIYHNHSRINQACRDIGFDSLPSIIWRKPINAPNKFMGSGMLPGGAYVTLEHEYILIFRKGIKRSFSAAEKKSRSESAIFWEDRNIWYSDLWTDIHGNKQRNNLSSLRNRSASFPSVLPQRLISMFSIYGDTVLDPFGGLGTTSLAAMALGRHSYSLDNDPELVDDMISTPTKRKMKAALNSILDDRLSRHMNAVSDKDMLFFRYRNEPMQIPVKTLQEKNIKIYPIKSISRKEDLITVKYRNMKSSEIQEILAIS